MVPRRHQVLHDLVPVLLLMLGFQRGGVGGADGLGADAHEDQDVQGDLDGTGTKHISC